MAFIQRNLPPPPKKYSFTLNNFSGGLNNNSSDQLIQDNQSSDVLNMDFTDEGLMRKRNGIDKIDDTDYGGIVTKIDTLQITGHNEILMVLTDDAIYADGTKISDLDSRPDGVQYIDKYYFIDGKKVRAYGKFPQDADKGTYIKITGTPTSDLIVMTLVDKPSSGEDPLDTSHTNGVWGYDYTKKEMWYSPCENELKDPYKGVNIIPKEPKIISLHGDRLFISDESEEILKTDDIKKTGKKQKIKGQVVISDIQNGLYFPTTLPISLPPTGEDITAMENFMDSIVVFRKNDVHVIYGNTNRQGLPDMFLRKKIHTHTGTMSRDSVTQVHNYLYYLGSDGLVYSMHTTRTDVLQLATVVLSEQLNLFKYPIELTTTDLSGGYGMFHDDKYYLLFPEKTLVYSYRFRAWTIFSSQQTKVFSLGKHNDKLVIGGNDGKLYEFKDNYKDGLYPIVAYWCSRRFDLGEPSRYKQIKEMFVVAHVFPKYVSDVNIRYEIDYIDVQQTAHIINQIAIWGKAKFGDRFITRNIAPSLPINIGQRGRVIRLCMANGHIVEHTVKDISERDALTPVDGMYVLVTDESKIYTYHLGNYTEVNSEDLYQPFMLYEINGEYQRRGKR